MTILTKQGIKWYSLFVGSLEDYKHDYCFPIGCFALIATSTILLISVPVVFASSDGWSSNKNVVFSGTSLWIGLVFW
uniref:Photosystem II reaction center protein Z n=1 Tax=Spirodela intermedia TaxID=51605 RepID=A0A8S0WST9_SPIIN